MEETKICSICGEKKPVDKFRKQLGNKDGLTKQCKSCICEKTRERYKNDLAFRERVKKSVKKWKNNNLKQVKNHSKEWREKNSEKLKKQNRDWRNNNKEHVNTYRRELRRAAKENNNPVFYERERKIKRRYYNKHKVEISRKRKEDRIKNITKYLNKEANYRQKNKYWLSKRFKKYQQENKDKIRNQRAESDYYLIQLLGGNSALLKEYPELIEAKRIQLKIKRELRTINH